MVTPAPGSKSVPSGCILPQSAAPEKVAIPGRRRIGGLGDSLASCRCAGWPFRVGCRAGARAAAGSNHRPVARAAPEEVHGMVMHHGSHQRPRPGPRPTTDFGRPALPERFCNLGRLLETMEQRGLDGIVAYLRPNVLYLSGFAPPASVAVQETNGYAAVVIARSEPDHPIIALAEFDVASFTGQPSWVKDVRPYATLLTPLDL